MAKITIIIEGIALCYLPDDKIWRVIFPFDTNKCHKVQYEHGNDKIPLAQANRVIDVEVVDGKTPSSEGPRLKKLFNLTEKADYEAHTDGISKKQHWEQHGVLMRIPNAKVSLVKETKSRYQLKLDGHFKYNFDKLGHSAKAEIEFNSGGSVTINVPGDPNFPKTFTEADDGKEIKLNNDCNLVQTVSDLELLYNFIIEDKINKTKKFEIDRHPADKPRSEKTSNEESNSNLRMESHDPAPLQEGLPCYVTRADDSTGLPEGD